MNVTGAAEENGQTAWGCDAAEALALGAGGGEKLRAQRRHGHLRVLDRLRGAGGRQEPSEASREVSTVRSWRRGLCHSDVEVW